MGVVADDDGAGLGEGLQPAGGVDDVAHRGRVATGAQGPDEHLAGVDADAHPQRVGARLGGEVGHRRLQPERGAHGTLGVVLVGDGGAEDGEQPVADDLVDTAAEVGDVGGQALEEAVDQVLDLLGVAAFGEGGEAHEVGEQDRDHPALVAAVDEGLAAVGAEARVGSGDRTAGATGHARCHAETRRHVRSLRSVRPETDAQSTM